VVNNMSFARRQQIDAEEGDGPQLRILADRIENSSARNGHSNGLKRRPRGRSQRPELAVLGWEFRRSRLTA
jgi:hypothetical protein